MNNNFTHGKLKGNSFLNFQTIVTVLPAGLAYAVKLLCTPSMNFTRQLDIFNANRFNIFNSASSLQVQIKPVTVHTPGRFVNIPKITA